MIISMESMAIMGSGVFVWDGRQAPRGAVNVKAKTHEKVDSLGENRSVACHAVVLLLQK